MGVFWRPSRLRASSFHADVRAFCALVRVYIESIPIEFLSRRCSRIMCVGACIDLKGSLELYSSFEQLSGPHKSCLMVCRQLLRTTRENRVGLLQCTARY